MNKILITDPDELARIVQGAVERAIAKTLPQEAYNSKLQQDLLTVKQAADFLSLKTPTVYALSSKHLIPVCRKNKRLYFNRNELLTWIQSGRKTILSEMGEI